MAQITKEQVYKALEKVIDPELHINIVDLGLIYDVEVTADNNVGVDMTLTTQACPIGPVIEMQARQVLQRLEDVNQVDVRFVFDPPWTPEKMSERLKKARAMGLI
ncbi:MAG: metal-sulfur cluster assembly factor [Mycobacterium leprae]